MSVTSGFFNSINGDRRYDARQMSALFNGIINDGVFANIGTSFFVSVNGDNNITVDTGRAWFNSTWIDNDTLLPLTLDVSELLLDRYDAVVIEVDHSNAVRACDIKIVKGVPASEPVYPNLTHTNELNQYPLAYIYRAAGSSVVTQANVINMVGTSATPYITGILQVQNIDNIVAQWQSEWNQWFSETQGEADAWTIERANEFNTWFEEIKSLLNEDMTAKHAEWNQWFSETQGEADAWTIERANEFNTWFEEIKSLLNEDIATLLANRLLALENGTKAAGSATKLETPKTFQTNLGSNEPVLFDGLNDVEPGVKGVLSVKNGGTGATTAANARKNLELGAAATYNVDTLPTSGSTSLVTSGGVHAELNKKAESSHTHTKSQIADFPSTMTPSAHNQAASTITAGTLAGQVKANAASVKSLGTAQVRNIYFGTEDMEAGVSNLPAGDMYFVIEEVTT